ncbi:TetR/AcrR family transcriptional regulator [Agromyces protaetiae]|uniref:TetR/AcrR family transcriptional regulator n=1 Tax=Agromyces protaetiae TaxID=2509455 RepID=A0A4P6F9R0_9MICO|nr:TetR/AcrR family transcriptional regulator [Agromyces protaetiae]QAY72504.1 TetR/AcrR family transcriptional regulator [Agromyces protaetiae]
MKPGPRRSISQTDIVVAAFEILEQKGFAAVSVRGVAAALGLTPTAMYTYFASKGALLGAMVEELIAGVGENETADPGYAVDPRAYLLETALALRARLREHAGAIVLVTSGPLDGPRAVALLERLGAAYVVAGLSTDDAARAAHALLAQVFGHVAVETAWAEASGAHEPVTLWNDTPPNPITEAGVALGLRAGDDGEFERAASRTIDGWLAVGVR